MNYELSYREKHHLSESTLTDAQRTLHYIAENMRMEKSISKDGYKHFQQAIEALSGSEKPNYTDAEIQKMQDLEFAEIQKAYEIGKDEGSEVLDKIRAEIEHIGGDDEKTFCKNLNESYKQGLKDALKVIDKYKESPTGEERSEE